MNRLILFLLLPFCAGAATTITDRTGIAWTVNGTPTTGQYANGDWWVVGPVTVTAISPATSGGINGSMTNPIVRVNGVKSGNTFQGFDARMNNTPPGNVYSASFNFATFLPSVVGVGTSIVSSQALPTVSGDDPCMQAIAIVTVVSAPQTIDKFRPPYVGTDKTSYWSTNGFVYANLGSVAPVAHTPSLSSVIGLFTNNWIEIETGWQGRYWHPNLNYPCLYPSAQPFGTYGRELAHTMEYGLLSLNLNYTAGQKAPLLIEIVQRGLDIYAAQTNGGYWGDGGGQNIGRKAVMMIAARALNDSAILSACSNATVHSEDQQTFYVSQADINLDHTQFPGSGGSTQVNYTQGQLGMPEWGANHQDQPQFDTASWGGANYRPVAGPCQIGHVMTAYLLGANANWNHQAYFDYFDRFWSIESNNVALSANSILPFSADMWNAYRNATPPVTPVCPPPSMAFNPASQSLSNIVVSLSDSIAGARIYYTKDGSIPTTSSTLYAGPFVVTSTLVVSAIATATGYTTSPVTSQTVEVNNFTDSGLIENIPCPVYSVPFSWTFSHVPSINNINDLIALSPTTANQLSDFAVIVRFDVSGVVQGRDGANYSALNSFSYSAGTPYNFSNYVISSTHKWACSVQTTNGPWVPILLNADWRETQLTAGPNTNLVLYVLATNTPPESARTYNVQFSTNSTPPADPVITVQPTNATILAIGGSTNFTIAANNTVAYQWYLAGQVIPGATSNVLTIVNAQCANSGGMYYCTATSAQGFIVQSATVSLTVIGCDPLFVVQPQNVILSPPSTAMFNVTVGGTAPLGGQWYSNAVIIAGATGFSYTTPPTTIKNNGDLYYFIATSGVGSKQSSTAQIQMGVAKVTNFAVKNAFINPH